MSGPRSGEAGDMDGENLGMAMDGEEEDIDEDEVIDVAEKIFIRIAQELVQVQQQQEQPSIREIFKEYIFEAEVDGNVFELIEPMGFLDCIKELGVDDLTEKEVQYLMRVLHKPELDGNIIFPEFL